MKEKTMTKNIKYKKRNGQIVTEKVEFEKWQAINVMLDFVSPFERDVAIERVLSSKDFWQTRKSIIDCAIDNSGSIRKIVK